MFWLAMATVLTVSPAAWAQDGGTARPDGKIAPMHGIAMHGDLKYPANFKHFDYVNPEATKGGTMRYSALGTFDSLNPFVLRSVAAEGSTEIYDSLLTPSADEAFSEYGLLARSVEMPADRSWVVFNLQPEARWHDGQPVTADDVVFTFETIKAKGHPQLRYYYAGVDKVTAEGPHRVRFTFKPGDNRELPLIVGQQAILPKHYWQGRDFERATLEPPLGSGPYRFDKVEAGRSVSYRRVPDYWGRNLPVNVGRHNFDAMSYDYYRDGNVALEAFKAGQYDFRLENAAKNWATGYDFPALRQGLVTKEVLDNHRSTGMQGFVYNTRRPLFADPKVREALAYAWDFEWTNARIFFGAYTRTESYFSNSELASTGLPEGDELKALEPFRSQLPPEVFTKTYQAPRTDGSGDARENLLTALRMLQEAGWRVRPDDGVMLDKEGQPVSFEILLIQPEFERIVAPFAGNLKRLGIEARIRTVDTAQYQNRLDSRDFDMIVGSWGESLSPGNEQTNFWTSQAADTPGSRNLAGIKNPVVDALVDKVISAPDRASLVARTRALDRVLLSGYYVIPQYHVKGDRVAYWSKFSRPAVTPTQGLQLDAWWIDPNRDSLVASAKAAATAQLQAEQAAQRGAQRGGHAGYWMAAALAGLLLLSAIVRSLRRRQDRGLPKRRLKG
ncbi:MAG TPA: extracellular solute-binding protein [Alphaproteobacteria bacterium]